MSSVSSDRRHGDLAILARLLRQARPYWSHLAGLLALSFLTAPVSLLLPLPLKLAVDSVIGGREMPHALHALPWARGPQSALLIAAGLVVVIAIVQQAQTLASGLLRRYASTRLVLDFRARIFEHVQRLSIAYHDTNGSTDAVYRIQYDAPAVQWITIDGLIPLVSAFATFAAMLWVAVRIDWPLAMVAVAISPILFGLARVSRRPLRRRSRRVKDLDSSAMEILEETLRSLRVVKTFGQERRHVDHYVAESRAGLRAIMSLAWVEGGFGALIGICTAAGTAGVLYLGIRHVQQGVLSLGDLLLLMGYIAQLLQPLRALSESVAVLQASLESASRVFALLDRAPDVADAGADAVALARAAGAVSFRGVDFSYDGDGARPVLADLTFEIPAGARVGIIGATGAGKTTLVSLLTRLFDPTRGAIYLDGIDLRRYRVADLRRQFSVVLQEPVLFSRSIGENIHYARPDASMDDVVAAAVAAGAHEFITRLPSGYDTPVGERGARLSGGERQRISLARAFLRNAPVLVLDEPTSSVDFRTEARIMEALDRLMEGRTTFMIAHRTSTLHRCDLILRVEDGRLVPVSGRPAAGAALPGLTLAPSIQEAFA